MREGARGKEVGTREEDLHLERKRGQGMEGKRQPGAPPLPHVPHTR